MTSDGQVSSLAREAADKLASRGMGRPQVAIILGSGLAGAVSIPSPNLVVGFDELHGFPQTSVAGHPGRVIDGELGGLDLLVIEGRYHLYEGQGLEGVRLLASLLKAVGVKEVILTTAAGALASFLRVGEFVVVRAHLVYPLGGRAVFLGRHSRPVAGRFSANTTGSLDPTKSAPEYGSGSNVYCPKIAARLEDACLEAGAAFQRGVLAFAEGPCYETAAEARTLSWAGAGVVSMSAAADAIVARGQGLRVGCLCFVTNSIGLSRGRAPSHEEVLAASGQARSKLGRIVAGYMSLALRGGIE